MNDHKPSDQQAHEAMIRRIVEELSPADRKILYREVMNRLPPDLKNRLEVPS